MTRQQERFVLYGFVLFFTFLSVRSIERRIWINEQFYEQGKDRANMVYIHKVMGGVFR